MISKAYITGENDKAHDADTYIDKTEYQNGQTILKGKVGVKDIQPLPKQLTIRYDKKLVEHRDVKWEIPIVTGK